jgi:hypothetical protein
MKIYPLFVAAAVVAGLTPALRAWDYDGHRLVNRVALAALPKDFPDFVRTPENAERIAFLAGEPDRWRNAGADLPLQHENGMDHYLDIEELAQAGLTLDQISSFRFEFALQFAAGRAAHPENFPVIDQAKNYDRSREWPGFAPWAITENFGKLRSGFSYLKVYREMGTPEEIANAERNIVYVMGVMGHYVGDSAQPLHTTMHHHGWVGPNPNGYTTWTGIHAWIDGGLIGKAGIHLDELTPRVTPAEPISLAPRADHRDPMFVLVLSYFAEQNKLVEPLYQLHKAGKLGDRDQPVSPEGREFVDHQLVSGGEMLATIWLTAWRTAGDDKFLRSSLAMRQAKASAPYPAPAPAK